MQAAAVPKGFCHRVERPLGESNGWRGKFYYPYRGDGTYAGHWRHSRPHGYGVKTAWTPTRDQLLTYDGQWQQGRRHGHGTIRRQAGVGRAERVYVGEWREDMKWGEGKQYFANGVYYGMWQRNRRHGLGMKWYYDGRVYLGEWQADAKHGRGILFYANGNRYEGNFARGYKNGAGTFYHMHTGQVQKGVWEDDVCRASLVSDEFRNQAERPTEYGIPKCGLVEPDEFVHDIFQPHMRNNEKPSKSFEEIKVLQFVHKLRLYAKFEPKAQSNSQFSINVMKFVCSCSYPKYQRNML